MNDADQVETNEDVNMQDELAALKERADLMKISYHPSIGLEKLREKVNKAIENSGKEAEEKEEEQAPAAQAKTKEETPAQRAKRLQDQALKLVRIRLTCMNPAKKEWNGEIFSVGNNAIGTVKKFVPFNADEGWHVPNIMYEMIRDRQCQVFTTVKSKHGVSVRQGKLIKEFAVEVLPDLTEKELQELARRQAIAKNVD